MFRKKLYIVAGLLLGMSMVACSQENTESESTKAAIERPYHAAAVKMEPTKLLEGRKKNVDTNVLPKVVINIADANYLLDKDHYEKATVAIENAGEYNLEASEAGIRIRGNSTSELAKRPLKIKFESKQSIFGKAKEKSWTLLANLCDKTLIHNYVAYDLYDYITPAGTFAPMCQFVELYVNDSYLGVYTLCDQVETGKDRINIEGKAKDTPEDTDYFIEHDYRIYYDDPENGQEGVYWFWMSELNECFNIKSPETGEAKYCEYIRDYMDQVYATAKKKDWSGVQNLIDVDSFINGFMIHEIFKNYDCSQTSIFYYKPAGDKLYFGPLWDCDLTCGSCDPGNLKVGEPEDGFVAENNFLFATLWEIPEFRARYIDRYNSIYEDALKHMNSVIDNVVEKYHTDLQSDYDRWESKYDYCVLSLKGLTYDEQITAMKNWLAKRTTWLYERYKTKR